MHLKRYGIIVSALLLAACQDEEAVQMTVSRDAVPIAFDCMAQEDEPVSRAANGYTGNITSTNNNLRYAGFGVFACLQAGHAPDLMYNQKVEYTFLANNTNAGYWTYAPPKYWPNKDDGETQTVCFYAYAPYVEKPADDFKDDPANTGIVGMSSNSDTNPYILYARANHPEENVDLLWRAYTPTAIKPIRFAVEKDENNVIVADHSLCHALARVKVSLGITNGSSLAAGSKLLVQRVTFTGSIARSARLDLTTAGTTPTWTDHTMEAAATIVIDHNPEVNTASYGIIAEDARYIDGLPIAWQPAGLPHVNYDASDATTKSNLLCMGDALSYLYLIPQDLLTLSCVIDYCVITAAGVKTDYHKTLATSSTITLSPLSGNKTYDLVLKITL